LAWIVPVLAVARFSDCVGSGVQSPEPSPVPYARDAGVSQSELDEAAVAACKWLWDNVPEAKTWEHCGVLFMDEAGQGVRVGLPERGKFPYQCLPADPPQGTVLLGRYHNHRFGAEPSSTDRRIARSEPSLGHYLCGPSGIVRRFSAKEGMVNVR